MPELTLIDAIEEGVLPHETRALREPVLDAASLRALAARVGTRVAVLFVTSRAELPAFVTARWATECTVLAATEDAIELRGERRVRITSVRGTEAPFTASVEVARDATSEPRPTALLSGAHALFAALELGAVPEAPGWVEPLEAALAQVVRAVGTSETIREALRAPPGEALQALARTLAARGPAQEASCALEAMLRKLADEPEPTPAMRRQLWAACVEIQKRLDVYDPATTEDTSELTRLSRRLEQAGLPRSARDVVRRELRTLRAMKPDHHDYSNYLKHLEWIARLPWHPDPERPIDLPRVRAALDREHHGLEKPKRRVLEYLAVRALGGSKGSMVLCLSGPPGVGKTSIARAVADALGRKFVRIPLGGVHDECELRGHRMSFQASAPGRIVAGIARAESASAVVLLDELDKLGADTSRSPYGALLEILDPEQNAGFQDNYLAVPFDLSHVLFIATANDPGAIHPTLVDRLEMVELEGYTVAEKEAIARAHLLSRLASEHGLPEACAIDEMALRAIIEGHTREAGVRQLTRALGAIHRARALARVEGAARTDAIDAAEVERVLGSPRFAVTRSMPELPIGVATGLSVGAEGGALLFVEVGTMPGKGELRLTGRLGDVMRESAHAALALLKMEPARFGLTRAALGRDVHVHVPEGATPKEGPSAGLALLVALVSAASGKRVRGDVALTGEITLSGRVLPVGGVRAKLLAAERAGITTVVVPEENRADVPEGLAAKVVLVRRVEAAIEVALGARVRPRSSARSSGKRAGGAA